MTDEPITDASIADFRAANSEALDSAAHPLHSQRLGELSELYERRFSAPAEIAAPAVSATEHRLKHDVALNDKSHPDHAVRTTELTAITERDTAETGNELALLTEPATSPEAYDFTKAKGMVPFGSELEPDATFENEVREVFHQSGVTPAESDIISMRWMESQRFGFEPPTPEQGMNSLRMQFGDKADVAVEGIRRLVTEAPPDLVQQLEEAGLANDPLIASQLAVIAKRKGFWS